MNAITFKPQLGAQTNFLASSADIAIYGGAAGGGKTFAVLMEALRHVYNKDFRAIVIRQTYKQITSPGAIWDESLKIYPYFGARPNISDLQWTFPSGASISFGYLDHDKDKLNYLGSQIALIIYDQLEQIKESNFFYMMSRNRSTSGVRPYIRATCNPDSDSWLAKFLAWWIDDEGFPIPDRAGKIRYMTRINGEIQWADTAIELTERYGDTTMPKSVTFIPAKLSDNPILMKIDPSYEGSLRALSYVDQARLLGGNWKVKHAAGNVFNRAWFEVVEIVPSEIVQRVRYWDRAATAGGGDYTVGALLAKGKNGLYYVEDVVRGQWGEGQVEAVMTQTAAIDYAKYGHDITIYVEQEGGSAGKESVSSIIRKLSKYSIKADKPTGDKQVRAKPLSAQAYAGNVKLVSGAWLSAYLDELESFPDSLHDDQVDASSGAYNKLNSGGWSWG